MISGILFDLDGVLYNDNRPIAGAVDAVGWVRARAIPHLFVTNTTSRPRSALVEKLGSFGIPATEAEIHTPPAVAAQWLRAHGQGEIALFLRPSTRSEFAGLPCLPDDAERGAAYVVIGDLEDMWDYHTLNRAFRLLHHNPEAKLIALGMTRYWLASHGLALDVAPYVAALEHATGRKALVFGKPAATFFLTAAERLALPAESVLMIGDDVTTDIGGAQAAGLKGALVKTGKFRPADLEGEIRPHAVFHSIADLPQWWNRS
jgi:HAD superfamily hydrolase (TIGR01458 family)